ncbi:hypothetical protein PPSIR1_17020 [Plesiocystis pacifica SIR-1]|uniref:Uncharacterized protein n=1 Tax=Plesiocystis pacifica SIR-1 TaxID=391625 RepID=A6GGJ7_9BACT|nr:hypothetical protein [Plesiocystis pacifica]EDM75023.1 hypothetical protein PPSIR1_17020 [Plesiocystis pacifica SIR-1]
MSKQSPSLLRGLAVCSSLTLGVLVVANAQFGCDAPKQGDAETDAPAAPEADAPTPEPAPEAAPEPMPDAKAEPTAAKAEPTNAAPSMADSLGDSRTFMPASKSGGDFGAARFPGEIGEGVQAADQDAAQQPNQNPQQQAAPRP